MDSRKFMKNRKKSEIIDIRCPKDNHKVAEVIENYIYIKCRKCKNHYVSINTTLLNNKK